MNIFFSPYTENLGLQFRFITDFNFGFGGVLLEYFFRILFSMVGQADISGFSLFCFF